MRNLFKTYKFVTLTKMSMLCCRNVFPLSLFLFRIKLDASNWDYLNHISMPKLNANVGLLIGCNYPQVLQPLEVIPSQMVDLML